MFNKTDNSARGDFLLALKHTLAQKYEMLGHVDDAAA